MRLTLRTLLAYLDGILEKGDAEELATKIHESEFATNQVHRIRDVTKRIRLAAPKVLGQGAGLDPNTVADYLDNTLPPERAPDFEKVCLESDVHLAEVAACHHILTIVLGEPAEVEASTRQRMYHLVQPGALAGQTVPPPPTHGDGAHAAPPPLAAVEPVAAVRRDLEVPEYLRRSSGRRFWPLIATALALLCGAAAFFILGNENLRKQLGLAANTPPADQPKQGDNPKPPVDQIPPARPIADKVAPRIDEVKSGDDVKPADDVKPGEPAPATDSKSQGDSADASPPPSAPIETPSPEIKPRDTTADVELKPIPNDPPNPPPPAPDLTDRPAAKTPLPAGAMIGQYAAPDDVLLRYDAKGETWVRLSPGTSLAVGDRLLALPGFRPPIVLNAGVALQLDGGTIIQLISGDDGAPGVHVEYGRLLRWGTTGKAGIACRARMGEHVGTIRFSDPDSAVMVEVYRYFEPGEDPSTAPGPIVADMAVVGGQIEWLADGEAQAAVLKAGMGRTWVGKTLATSKPVLKIPGWIDPLQLSEIEKRGVMEVKKALEPDKPVGLATRELIEVRRSETRSLAARGVGFLGKYDALLAGLKDESLAWAQWRVKYVGGLRSAILRGPEEATRVRDALIKDFGAKTGADLYRMLCGYNPRQLASGADEGLVDLLAHSELPYRVLAFYNLQAITQVSHGYRPEGTEIQRRTPTQTWRAWQKSGRIVYKEATPGKNGAAENGKGNTEPGNPKVE